MASLLTPSWEQVGGRVTIGEVFVCVLFVKKSPSNYDCFVKKNPSIFTIQVCLIYKYIYYRSIFTTWSHHREVLLHTFENVHRPRETCFWTAASAQQLRWRQRLRGSKKKKQRKGGKQKGEKQINREVSVCTQGGRVKRPGSGKRQRLLTLLTLH